MCAMPTMSDLPNRLPIAVLISGGGTTLRNLMRLVDSGDLEVDIRLVISSNPNAGGLKFARDAKIPTKIVKRSDQTDQQYMAAIFDPCRDVAARLVVMAGFLKHVLIPEDFVGRVMNIHPSLIPAFCGPGFYGERVHKAALDYGVRFSGCTVHFVDDHYDHGPIILQRCVNVDNNDTATTLASRVFEQECEALPTAIRLFAEGRLRIEDRRVIVAST